MCLYGRGDGLISREPNAFLSTHLERLAGGTKQAPRKNMGTDIITSPETRRDVTLAPQYLNFIFCDALLPSRLDAAHSNHRPNHGGLASSKSLGAGWRFHRVQSRSHPASGAICLLPQLALRSLPLSERFRSLVSVRVWGSVEFQSPHDRGRAEKVRSDHLHFLGSSPATRQAILYFRSRTDSSSPFPCRAIPSSP